MTTASPHGPAVHAAAETARSRTGMFRVGVGLLAGTGAWAVPLATGSSVLLPARIETIAPAQKVALLAVLTAAAAAVGLVANVVIGALSDRTRGRFGARTPWILGGGAATAVSMVVLSRQESYPALLVWWCLSVLAINAVIAAVAAILPDRVPVERRATLSAVVGTGILVGYAVGAAIGAAFVHAVGTGLVVAGITGAVLAVVSVLVAPDLPTDAHGPAVAAPGRRAVRIPRGAPDFYWALWGRFALVLGYFMINSYQLYILTDHIGLTDEHAVRIIGVNAVLFLAAALLSTVLFGPLSDRTRRRKPFVIGASLVAVLAITVPLVSPTAAGMMAFACVGGLAFGVYYAVDAALMSEVLPNQDSRGRDLGILNIANTGGQVLAPLATSLLVGAGAGYPAAFGGAILACVAGAALIVPIRTVR